MSFLDPSGRAFQNWKALDEQQRYAAVAWGADYVQERLDTTYEGEMGEGILGVGCGARESRARRKGRTTYEEYPVITIFVKKSFEKSFRKKTNRDKYPRWVQLTVPIEPKRKVRKGPSWPSTERKAKKARKRRLVVALPVDVTMETEAKAEAAATRTPQAQRLLVISDSASAAPEAGSSCALVRIRRNPPSKKRYVLSCHHVVWRSRKRKDLKKDKTAKIWSMRAPPKTKAARIQMIG
ncbi:MAG: hypothetical protein ACYTG6_07765, partial [Planctomycetota bacterium]